MFTTSQPFLFFDYFRVPYRVEESEHQGAGAYASVRVEGAGRRAPALYWPEPDESVAPGSYRLDGIPLFGRIVPDEHSAPGRESLGGRWHAEAEIEDEAGRVAASIWRDERGSVLLPFDPGDAMRTFWSEGYQGLGGGTRAGQAKRLVMRAYYRLRPVLPRSAQIGMRRAFSRVQARTRFPQWPAETGLHDLYDLLLRLLASVAGEPVPYIAPWPAGRSWALVLTHDVETSVGYEHVRPVRDVELAAGCRSSWNFVPKRYVVEDRDLEDLRALGFEIGVHGLYHDGRDLESRAVLEERLPEMRAYAERWRATGFRSPATHRQWEWMPLLGFDYDSSYPDTDPFEPQGGGCCTWLPFFNDGMVELPITLPQDHTLFVILRRGSSAWFEKADLLRRRGGMALLDTHPDYLLGDDRLDLYARFLAHATADPAVWCALPSEVSAWWRRRADSTIERCRDAWRVAGPAADEAAVALGPSSAEGGAATRKAEETAMPF